MCVLLAFFACCASEETSHLEVHSQPSLNSPFIPLFQGAPGPSKNLFPHITAARLALQRKQAAFRAANFLKTESTPRPRAEHVTAEVLEWDERNHHEAKRELNAAQEHLDRLVHLLKEELAINCKEYTGSKVGISCQSTHSSTIVECRVKVGENVKSRCLGDGVSMEQLVIIIWSNW